MSHLQCTKCGHRFHDEQARGSHTAEFPGEPDEVFYSRAGKAEEDSAAEENALHCPVCGMVQKILKAVDAPAAGTLTKQTMRFQNNRLPQGTVFAGATPLLDEKSVPPPMLHKHLAPSGKCGYLVVTSGHLRFVWEDTGEILDAAPGHPVVIFPEKFHHVQLTGPVKFHVEFYRIPQSSAASPQPGLRPGEDFIDQ